MHDFSILWLRRLGATAQTFAGVEPVRVFPEEALADSPCAVAFSDDAKSVVVSCTNGSVLLAQQYSSGHVDPDQLHVQRLHDAEHALDSVLQKIPGIFENTVLYRIIP